VTSVLQTTAGKMIFCRWPEATAAASAEGESRRDGRPPERRDDHRDPRGGRENRGEHRRESDRREGGERPAAAEAHRAANGGPEPSPAPPTATNGPSPRE